MKNINDYIENVVKAEEMEKIIFNEKEKLEYMKAKEIEFEAKIAKPVVGYYQKMINTTTEQIDEIVHEINKNEREIKSLEYDIESLKEEIENYEENIKNLKDKIFRYKINLPAESARIAKQKEENYALFVETQNRTKEQEDYIAELEIQYSNKFSIVDEDPFEYIGAYEKDIKHRSSRRKNTELKKLRKKKMVNEVLGYELESGNVDAWFAAMYSKGDPDLILSRRPWYESKSYGGHRHMHREAKQKLSCREKSDMLSTDEIYNIGCDISDAKAILDEALIDLITLKDQTKSFQNEQNNYSTDEEELLPALAAEQRHCDELQEDLDNLIGVLRNF